MKWKLPGRWSGIDSGGPPSVCVCVWEALNATDELIRIPLFKEGGDVARVQKGSWIIDRHAVGWWIFMQVSFGFDAAGSIAFWMAASIRL